MQSSDNVSIEEYVAPVPDPKPTLTEITNTNHDQPIAKPITFKSTSIHAEHQDLEEDDYHTDMDISSKLLNNLECIQM